MLDSQQINTQKLKIYRIVAPLGVATIVGFTFFEMSRVELTLFDFVSRGIIALAYAIISFLLWRKKAAISIFEQVVFFIVAGFFASQFYMMLYNLHVYGASTVLATLPQWLPMVYLLTNVTFSAQRSLIVSWVFFLIIFVPGVLFIVLNPGTLYSRNIINIYVAHTIFIFCVYAINQLMHYYARIEALKIQAEHENKALQEALENIKTLHGLIPICAHCKKIRDDAGYWQDVAVYVRDHSEAEFSHGICPSCVDELYPELVEKRRQRAEKKAAQTSP